MISPAFNCKPWPEGSVKYSPLVSVGNSYCSHSTTFSGSSTVIPRILIVNKFSLLQPAKSLYSLNI